MGERGTAGAAVRLWARSELARRWKALVALGVIAGVAAGLALAAIAGARQTSTAYQRWRKATLAPDAIVFGTQIGSHDTDYTPVMKLPEVVDGGLVELAQVGLVGRQIASLPAGDTHLYRTVARPLIREGRLARQGSLDEVTVNRTAAKQLHLHVGQRVTINSGLDLNSFYGLGPTDTGPHQPATIVGIGDSMIDYSFLPNQPGFVPPADYLLQHPEIQRAPNLVVRLKPGTDVAKFHERADAALQQPGIPVRDLSQDAKRFTHGTDLERTGLWLFAAAVALAALVLIGQALARTVYAMAEPAPALRALGFTHGNLVGGLLLPATVTAAVAALVSTVSAYVLSARFPVGLARQLDPSLGYHLDWQVLLPGAVIVVLLVMAGTAFAGWRAAVASEHPPSSTVGAPMLRRLRNVLPLPVALGTGLALQAGTGKRAIPVRPAIAGAVAGILGIVGALGLVRGIDDALHTPERSGQLWDVAITPDNPDRPQSYYADTLRADKNVATASLMLLAPQDINGAGLPVYTVEAVKSVKRFVVLNGRGPRRADEVALGPATVKALHRSIGDTVRITGASGPRTFRVVGTTLLVQTPHASFDQGAWVSPEGMNALSPGFRNGDTTFAVTARPGVKQAALIKELTPKFDGDEVDPGNEAPQDVLLLQNVRSLPRALAAFLALLGIAAVGHALLMTVRRRRHDLAVLRAMGLRPRQSAAAIFWQAMTVAVVALVLGIPLGVILGRVSWRWVADSTPLLYVPPIAALAIVIAIPAAILLANALAAYPARRAAGVRPAEVLRTE
ncbi:MAG: ABC transporter permease [Acidimicrobiia bacterium]|nr:ABC transporter permease [Acidimicrobiia bacterium]